ncbi:hypothetical protein PR048_006520 [Dryococelus australis]|uniref:Mutator-like transposase domain-containing protein n=1 Tax=Dryococelus australis TaxID=614101 RepID=A0ABQ9ICE8_9NEOP|nr:hypothetical protein PR048_006520 [Dryococelus australis]
MQSKFHFRCSMCGTVKILNSEDPSKETHMDIIYSWVSSTSSGQGYAQVRYISPMLEIPGMTNNTFLKHQISLSLVIHYVAWQEMESTGMEDVELAISSGSVDGNGIPVITVTTDGAWYKRSFGTKIVCSNHILRNYSLQLREIGKKTINAAGLIPVSASKALSAERQLRLHAAVTGNLKDVGMWDEITAARNLVALHASSLIYNVSTNQAETFNSIVCKYVGGKRVNHCLRGCESQDHGFKKKKDVFLKSLVLSDDRNSLQVNTTTQGNCDL